jgi:hypothetical protein
MRMILAAMTCLSALSASVFAAETSAPSAARQTTGIPPHYKPGHSGCRPGAGYSFIAEAPGHPSTYPKLLLRVFDGEVIGIVFEADAEAGWKPWYDQPAGKPISHGNGPLHYSQSLYFKSAPTADDCAKSAGPFKKRN